MDADLFNTLFDYQRKTLQCLEIKAMQQKIDIAETSNVIDLDDDNATLLNMTKRINFLTAKL
jgi:hypothetical protein